MHRPQTFSQAWWLVMLLVAITSGIIHVSAIKGQELPQVTPTPTNTPTNTPTPGTTPTPTPTATSTQQTITVYEIVWGNYCSGIGNIQSGNYQLAAISGEAVWGNATGGTRYRLSSGRGLAPIVTVSPTSTPTRAATATKLPLNTATPTQTPVVPTATPPPLPLATPTPRATSSTQIYLPMILSE